MLKAALIIFLLLICAIPANSINFEGVYDNEKIVFSPSANYWTCSEMFSSDGIILTKHVLNSEKNSNYTYKCGEFNLTSDFEFLYDGRLIGVDNNNLKFYEIIYVNNKFEEVPLSYNQLQMLFTDVDVIKISDFSSGTYTVINNNERKEIILYNDTDEKFNNYAFTPELSIINKDIKADIVLPKRGKVIFADISDKQSKSYTIKVK